MNNKSAPTINDGPLVGIWWDNGSRLVVRCHSPCENTFQGAWLDSELNHIDEWPSVAVEFGLRETVEYFSIPRGRVLLRPGTFNAMIYHGNGTAADRLQVIAERFRLQTWEAKTDPHYAIGAEADAFFDENDGLT